MVDVINERPQIITTTISTKQSDQKNYKHTVTLKCLGCDLNIVSDAGDAADGQPEAPQHPPLQPDPPQPNLLIQFSGMEHSLSHKEV